MSFAVVLLVVGIERLAAEGGPLVAAVVLRVGAVFVRRQLRLETPLLDLRLLCSRCWTCACCAAASRPLVRDAAPGRWSGTPVVQDRRRTAAALPARAR
ncbi:hypothetical protein RKE29_15070 [Streptomyces sp. B1866]|uniref:hypothetical protein n=1 Tax=Streptomyces sp. B1866 TaxID=3075431 RepID=UPI00288CF1AB|nr:hypothetical protein [Streptomyces sp. B1866]MDT3397949.1 hypothetical protein [Streptomyces sp. B1866]